MKSDQIDLQWRLIYAIIVAGKSAKFTESVMGKFDAHRQQHDPFDFIKILIDEDNLGFVLRDIRCGNYRKIDRALRELVAAELNLETCEPVDLEKIHGIGPKTSRFFILWTRPDAHYAALDVHVLRWLKNHGYNAPPTTPSSPAKYAELEQAFLTEARIYGLTPRQLDSQIWEVGSRRAAA